MLVRELTQFVNSQSDVLRQTQNELKETQDELKEEKAKRRSLKVRLEKMERLYEELSLRMEATRCRCGCSEAEEERLDAIDVENLLEGFSVGDDDEVPDPPSTFGERGQVSDRGRGLHRRGRISA